MLRRRHYRGAGFSYKSDTTERLTGKTDPNGNYKFLNLFPGMYNLELEQPRFKRVTRDQIQVRAVNATRVDVSLELGDMTQGGQVASKLFCYKPNRRS
jgi:hypothetical protein